MNNLLLRLKKVLRKSYFLLSLSGVLRLRHTTQQPIEARSIKSINQSIIRLDSFNFPQKSLRATIVTQKYRHSFVPGRPTVESWSVTRKTSYSQSRLYQETQYFQLRKLLSKSSITTSQPFAIFPHTTNHFGHWIGDCLGPILFFSKLLKEELNPRKLLVYAPSQDWEDYLSELCPPDHIHFADSSFMLDHNLFLDDALLLPRLSVWQGVNYARNRISDHLSTCPTSDLAKRRKVFLTSSRETRIQNISQVSRIFEQNGYLVVNPLEMKILPLLQLLSSATHLWSEHGSMVLNLLLSRTQSFNLFAPNTSDAYASNSFDEFMVGGGVYNSLLDGLANLKKCQVVPTDSSIINPQLHPYQHCIWVDPSELAAELSLET